jgi:hypothetical protein
MPGAHRRERSVAQDEEASSPLQLKKAQTRLRFLIKHSGEQGNQWRMFTTGKKSSIMPKISKIRSIERKKISSLAVFQKGTFLTIVFCEMEAILSSDTHQ